MGTTDTTTRPKRSRLREPGRKAPRPDTRQRGPGRTRPVSAEEIVPRVTDDARGAYARLHRAALEQALDGIPAGTHGRLPLAASRATSRTWDLTRGLVPHDAEAVRLRVLDEVGAVHGLDRLRGGFDLGTDGAHGEEFVVPRPHVVEGEAPRRSGKRHR